MELSELISYRHRLLAICDYTGLIFKIQPGHSTVFQRYAIADGMPPCVTSLVAFLIRGLSLAGDGDEAKPFKGEWATVKDGVVWVGSVGKEWVKVRPSDSPSVCAGRMTLLRARAGRRDCASQRRMGESHPRHWQN